MLHNVITKKEMLTVTIVNDGKLRFTITIITDKEVSKNKDILKNPNPSLKLLKIKWILRLRNNFL
jgi:hypothetical protein